MSHIYENPVETEEDLLARILSGCVNVQKYARYICIRTQQTLCVTCNFTVKSQAASSIANANYSKILPLKFTIIERFDKYIENDKKKIKSIFQAGIF
jgi:hypothetical protein